MEEGRLRGDRVALAGALLGYVALFLLNQRDMPADDPLYYAEIAHRLAEDPGGALARLGSHPWEMRVGLTVPLAVLYRVFGVSALVTNLPGLLAALAILVVVHRAMPTRRAQRIAMGLALCCSQLARHAATLNVDLPMAALLACSALWLTFRERRGGARWVAAAMAAWFAAFLVKETAIWCAPIWGYAVIVDGRELGWRAVRERYAAALGLGVALGLGYLALCAWLWGSPLVRLHGIQALTFQHGWSMRGGSTEQWLARLTWAPALLVLQMFRGLLVPALCGLWMVRGRDAVWVVGLVTTLGLFWFGSSSVTAYEPLPLWPRMVLPMLPFLLVVAGLASDALVERAARWRHGKRAAFGFAALLVVPAALATAGNLRRSCAETAAYAALRGELAALPAEAPVVLVCGDRWCPTLTRFHFGFAPPRNLRVVEAAELAATVPAQGAAATRAFALVHQRRAAAAGAIEAECLLARRWPPRFARDDVRLFAVPALAELQQQGACAAAR